MEKKQYKPSLLLRVAPYLIGVAVFALVLHIVVLGLSGAGQTAQAEGIRLAEESIRRAVVNCYATEGHYPRDYAYVKEHYGVSVDEDKYTIHYEIFASNLMPDVRVSKKERTSAL